MDISAKRNTQSDKLQSTSTTAADIGEAIDRCSSKVNELKSDLKSLVQAAREHLLKHTAASGMTLIHAIEEAEEWL